MKLSKQSIHKKSFLLLLVVIIIITSYFTVLSYSYSNGIIIYLKSRFRGCPTCTHDDLYRPWNYAQELERALIGMGFTNIEIKVLENNTATKGELNSLRRMLEVPEDIQGWITVDLFDRFLFISNEGIPIKIVTDFLQNHTNEYTRIVVYRDELTNTYQIINENGVARDCKIEKSIVECSSGGLFNLPPILVVVAGGFIDSINPCAFAAMLLFLAIIKLTEATRVEKKQNLRFLFSGLIYISAVFLSYLMIGLGILNVIRVVPFSRTFGIFSALLVIVMGALSLNDSLGLGKFRVGIPPSLWELLRKWMRKFTFPSAIVLGFMVSLFEFPCSGSVYISILGYLAFTSTFFNGLFYLLVYNLIFVLPLIMILILVLKSDDFGFSLKRWGSEGGKVLKLVSGFFMIVIGLTFLIYLMR